MQAEKDAQTSRGSRAGATVMEPLRCGEMSMVQAWRSEGGEAEERLSSPTYQYDFFKNDSRPVEKNWEWVVAIKF